MLLKKRLISPPTEYIYVASGSYVPQVAIEPKPDPEVTIDQFFPNTCPSFFLKKGTAEDLSPGFGGAEHVFYFFFFNSASMAC